MNKITVGPVDSTTTFPTAYSAALAATDKSARHLAVDWDSLSRARKAQREFCSRVNDLCKLLAREFPGREINFSYAHSAAAKKEAETSAFRVCVWMIDGNKIERSILMCGSSEHVCVVVESHQYPHHNCSIDAGQDVLVTVPMRKTWTTALRAIKGTPYVTYAS